MWAQLIMMRLKPGKDTELPRLYEELRATEQPGSGLLRTTAFRDQKDPSRIYHMVVFESEEQARQREQDSRRTEGMNTARATMAEIFEGPPEFVDLTVIEESSYCSVTQPTTVPYMSLSGYDSSSRRSPSGPEK